MTRPAWRSTWATSRFSYPDAVVRETAGTYSYTWVAATPGLVPRVWVGEAGSFYAETEREWFRVRDSNLV